MWNISRLAVLTLTIGAAFTAPAPTAATPRDGGLPLALPNDNRTAAGRLDNGTLTLQLRAQLARWRPEGESGPELTVETLGEMSRAPLIPAPLIRVAEGTRIAVTVVNDLDAALRVHGFCAHDTPACAPVEILPGSDASVEFVAARAGTYSYWATTTGMPLNFRGATDTQLSGAFVVDPPGSRAPDDRILVITEWSTLTRAGLRELANAPDTGAAFRAMNPRFTFLINGLSWPATERFSYHVGEDVRWRVLNLSTQTHPMHLHGFFFEVTARGDGIVDQTLPDAERQRVVTHTLTSGATMAMRWEPTRAGNWLFHCHIAEHIAPQRRLGAAGDAHADHHEMMGGMASMVVGVTVTERATTAPTIVRADRDADVSGSGERASAVPARQMTLLIRAEARPGASRPAYGFALAEGNGVSPLRISVPGPLLTLRRGEPVEITLVNTLQEPTSIHWHGMELDSYYDGVHGWSGAGLRTTPLIQPGETFVVRFTPPQAGTFIYHTHMHDDRQLTSGMYGGLLVLEPGDRFDPETDHVMVIGRAGPEVDAATLINGAPAPLEVWRAGTRHRVRLINITPGDVVVASLGTPDAPVTWQPLAKDAAPVPPALATEQPAAVTIAVGETYDFIVDAPPGRRAWWLNLRSPGGRWQAQARIVVK